MTDFPNGTAFDGTADLIIDDAETGGLDRIVLGAGLTGALSYDFSGDDLVISIAGAPGTITVVGQGDREGGVEELVQEDGLGGFVTIEADLNAAGLTVDDSPVFEFVNEDGPSGSFTRNQLLVESTGNPFNSSLVSVNGVQLGTGNQDLGPVTQFIDGVEVEVGSIRATSTAIFFDPVADFFGTVEIDYVVEDADGNRENDSVFFDLAPNDDAPVAQAATTSIDEDGTLDVSAFLADFVSDPDNDFTDGDPDTLTIVSATLTSGAGQITGDAASGFVFTPDAQALDTGEDAIVTIDYIVEDLTGLSDIETLTVTVTGVNDAPVLDDAVVAFDYDENANSIVADFSASDVDVEDLTFSIGGADADLFSIDSVTGALTFVGLPDFEAPADQDTDNVYDIDVSVSDGDLIDTAAVTVTVTDVNESPVAQDDAAAVLANLSDLPGQQQRRVRQCADQ